MKHLLKIDQYNFNKINNVKEALLKASENGLVNKTNIEEISNYFIEPELGTFDYFVISDFISHGDFDRMEMYLDEFDKLGIDTKKCRELMPKYQRMIKIDSLIEEMDMPFNRDDRDEAEYNKLNMEYDKLHSYYKEYEKEIIILKEKARNL